MAEDAVTYAYILSRPCLTRLGPSSDPAIFVSRLLNHHRLPANVRWAPATSSSTTQVSDSAYFRGQQVLSLHTGAGSSSAEWLRTEVQPALVQFGQVLRRAIYPTLTTLVPRHTTTRWSVGAQVDHLVQLEITLEHATRTAAHTRAHKHSGELGFTHWLQSALVGPLDEILQLVPLADPRAKVYMRFVGIGDAGKPDLECVYDCEPDDDESEPEPLVCFEAKTGQSVPPELIDDIPAAFRDEMLALRNGRVQVVRPGGLAEHSRRFVEQVSCARGQGCSMGGYCVLRRDQPLGVPGGRGVGLMGISANRRISYSPHPAGADTRSDSTTPAWSLFKMITAVSLLAGLSP